MKKIMISVIILVTIVTENVLFGQQTLNHDYPRIAVLSWAGGNPKWLSKFDLILAGANRDSAIFKSVKTINPNSYILQSLDWNVGGPFRVWGNPEAIPAEWRVRHSDGSYVSMYSSGEYMLDVTAYCGLSNSEKYNEALPRRLMETTSWSTFDGLSSDGTWSFPWNTGGDIDLDRNGVNDFTEHGQAWIKKVWQAGQNILRNNIRNKYNEKWGNPNAKLIFFWTIDDTMCIRVSNGMGWENMYKNAPRTFIDGYSLFNQWDTIGVKPRINVITFDTDYDLAHAPANRPKDYFRFMRFGLTATLLHDAYFMTGNGVDHHWSEYYDEYDVKLGYPKGRAKKLSNGCYVRFFDNGVSIVNPTSSEKTVSNSDLAGLAGYAGPYYRFKGNQDPLWNDGSLFTSVDLISTAASGGSQYIGDGIILVNTPTTIVSDIIIDNAYSATSAGSRTATLTGFTWDQSAQYDAPNPTWYTSSQHKASDANYYDSYYAVAGNGSAKAVYKPKINIPGKYKIYEWHGWRGRNSSSYTEASNVPCIIVHANGTTNLTIDQTKNYGTWNLLGEFEFTCSGQDSVFITNNANGYVIVDAFKFEYVVESESQPGVPNLLDPSNGAINIPTSVTLTWNTSVNANNYRLQIGTDSTFNTLVFDDSNLTQTSKQVTMLSNNSVYFWHVNARNNNGISAYSSTRRFTTIIDLPSVPVLAQPIDGAQGVSTTLTLVWNASANTSTYRVQLSKDSLFSTLVINDSTLTGTSKQVGPLSSNMKYFWRVNAKNIAGTSSFSNISRFMTLAETSASAVQLTFSRKSIDYGKVIVGTSKKDSITLFNPGTKQVAITKILSTKSQYTFSPPTMSILPGGQQNLYVTFYADRKDTIPGFIFQIIDSLNIIDTIKVTGRGVAPPKISRKTRSLYITLTDSTRIDSFIVYNIGEADLSISSVKSTEPSFSITPTSANIAPADSQYFYLRSTSKDSQTKKGYIIFIDNSNPTPDSMFVELTINMDIPTPENVPSNYSLEQNYPNPFNPTTVIGYQLPVDGYVNIVLYNSIGQEIKTIVDEMQEAGSYSSIWNAMNNDGLSVPSGAYFYRIKVYDNDNQATFSEVKRMLLVK